MCAPQLLTDSAGSHHVPDGILLGVERRVGRLGVAIQIKEAILHCR